MTATVHAVRGRRLTLGAAVLLLLPALAACGGGTTTASGGDASTSAPGASPPQTSTPPDGPVTSTSPDEVVPEVTSTVAGSAVGGINGGDDGSADPSSETVRRGTTCEGWDGGGGTWTQGLVEGAKITVRDGATGAVIGTGRLGAGAARELGTVQGQRQWLCAFPFTAAVRGAVPATLRLDVVGARPMTARPDPTAPGRFVASVSTDASPRLVPGCQGLPNGAAELVWARAVGRYWKDGLQQICSSGTAVTVKRVCRPEQLGSDVVAAVVKEDDPTVVYEDVSGLYLENAADLGDAPRVLVRVTNGQPCA